MNVLIVEDEPLVAKALARPLRLLATIEVAATASQARLQIDEKPPSILIVDAILPDGSGLEVVNHARLRNPIAEALVVSGDPRVANRAFDMHASFLLKPFEGRQLVQFFKRSVAIQRDRGERVRAVVESWQGSYDLTRAETDLLHAVVDGATRRELPHVLHKTDNTVKTQIRSLLAKTERESVRDLISDIFRDATR